MFALEGYTTRIQFNWQTEPARTMRAEVRVKLYDPANLQTPLKETVFNVEVSPAGCKVYNTSQGLCHNKDFLRQVKTLANTYFLGVHHTKLKGPQVSAICALSHDPQEIPIWSDSLELQLSPPEPNPLPTIEAL